MCQDGKGEIKVWETVHLLVLSSPELIRELCMMYDSHKLQSIRAQYPSQLKNRNIAFVSIWWWQWSDFFNSTIISS